MASTTSTHKRKTRVLHRSIILGNTEGLDESDEEYSDGKDGFLETQYDCFIQSTSESTSLTSSTSLNISPSFHCIPFSSTSTVSDIGTASPAMFDPNDQPGTNKPAQNASSTNNLAIVVPVIGIFVFCLAVAATFTFLKKKSRTRVVDMEAATVRGEENQGLV